ncbi:endonuclease [Pedobacter immunditicola]|uniref:endonuclease n=1 Tax=Pedobacter immunditicola TaxID=3133440 RepID=UPI0030A9C05B
MPEGPFMFYLKEKVQPFVGNKVLEATGESKKMDVNRLVDQPVLDFKTHGKEFFICFPDFAVRIHLMLLGYYRINEKKEDGKLKLGMRFESGELNFYACESTIIEETLDEVIDWTTDIMNPDWNPERALEKVFQKPKLMACDALLDQDIFSGVGNKLKDEILFETHVHPESIIGKIPEAKLKEMIEVAVIKGFEHLEWERSDRTEGGMKIHYQKACPRDHTPIHLRTLGKTKRTAYFCEKCQELYA